MKQIITIQVGQFGNQVGNALWNQMKDDSQLDQKFFRNEIPRTILVDSEPSTLDRIRADKKLMFYDPDNFVCRNNLKCSKYSSGYHGVGELFDQVVETIRKEAEKCDGVQAVQLLHSISGGTGSGLGAKLVYFTCDEFFVASKINVTLFPTKNETNLLSPYNSVLGLMHLNYNYNMGFYFDNEALQQLTENMYIQEMTHNTYNQLIAYSMDGVYKSLRHNCQPNTNFNKIQTNLTPFPRLHCYTISLSPLLSQLDEPKLSKVCKEIYSKRNQTLSQNMLTGRFLAQSIMIYGNTNIFSVDQEIKQAIRTDDIQFTRWIADPITYSICPEPQKNGKLMAFAINHHTSIGLKLSQLTQQFRTMFQRKAYLHLYLQEGMEEMDFVEAESACGDVISEYCCYNDCTETTDE